MSAIIILLISILLLLIGYIFYGGWLVKIWGIDPKRKTPAEAICDDKDYIPTNNSVLFGHHFASIAGAGPINGPIQAAIFGWLPVVLWIIIGGIFFGGAQDLSSLFTSIRNNGKSIIYITETKLGKYGKQLFFIFALFTLLFLNASFIDIVSSSFNGFTITGGQVIENGSAATASILFIIISLIFGKILHKNKFNLIFSSVLGIILISLCIIVGLYYPLYLNKTAWIIILMIYVFFASITPVWILLQPRDFLNSCLLYAMCILAIIGVLFTNPKMSLPAFTGFNIAGQHLFPMLFIIVACGAISGFHSLVCSGTTSKQIKSESNIKHIGFGAMIIESIIAIIAIVVVGSFFNQNNIYQATTSIIFANSVANLSANIGLDTNAIYTIIMLAISALVLTTLDTATRLARYLIQEFYQDNRIKKFKKLFSNSYTATIITVLISGLLAFGGIKSTWLLFGTVNQLLAAIAMLTISVWLGSKGKNNIVLIFPMSFMLVAAISSLILLLYNNIVKLVAGMGTFLKEGIQVIIIIFLIFLSINLTVNCLKILLDFSKKRKRIRKYKNI